MAPAKATQIDDATLKRMIAYHYHSRDRAYLADYGTSVWVIINRLRGTKWNIGEVADEYGLPEVAVRAAIRYYERNRKFIDARILLQSEANDA